MKKRIIFSVLLIYTCLFYLIPISEGEWIDHYVNYSFELSADDFFVIYFNGSQGSKFDIIISLSIEIDLYMVDDPNLQKYLQQEGFYYLSDFSFIGVSVKTFDFIKPSSSIYYLIIDNTDIFGTQSNFPAYGIVEIEYFKFEDNNTTNSQFNEFLGFLFISLGVLGIIVILAAVYKSVKKSKRSGKEEGQVYYYCTQCGNKIPHGVLICPKCGSEN